jgi:cobalt/nickel transport system permease protein
MIIFEDLFRAGWLSRLDPRVRVACAFAFAVLICLCREPVVLGGGLAVALLLLSFSGVPPRRVLRRLGAVNAFLLVLLVTLPPFVPGASLASLGAVTWSVAGVHRVLLVAARANAVMMMLTALLGSMESAHLGFALGGVGVPEKFTHLFLFMVRYIEIIHQEYHRTRDAMALRGFRPGFNRHAFRAFGFLVAHLLVRSLQRAERVLDAMKCRGFRGRYYVLTPWCIRVRDLAFAVGAFTFLAALAVAEWT